MIPITLKGLAKFMTSTSATQRKILRDYKYPKEEGYAMALYYKEARDLVRSAHKDEQPPQWLRDQALLIRKLAQASGRQSGRRLLNNARAIEEYAGAFSSRKFEILPDLDASMIVDDVKIKINPDLHVKESGKEKIVKLEFSRAELEEQVIKIICQTMFEGVAANGKRFSPSCVLYLDVPRGVAHTGARQGSRMRGEIEAACKNIAAVWPGI
jgi:hypothetical protein